MCGNRILKAFANSLDPDETPQNVASHLDPNCLNFNFKGQHITDIRNSVKLWHHEWYVSAQCLLEKGYWNKQRDSTLHSYFNM
ncbi:hypothetical protein DPMN_077510 [Dreissena polymorpha]|uniref:Uncharacterized protein n=1 Tax=Dreissena polymorpha TaxID=45954 RepID=A0A9D3YKL9_DREPO|nr:hypothetical protein DPMN_077510 [Dreissena polymorpha]